jgi:translation initiation factor IF-3
MLGSKPLSEALAMARERELDLVEVAPLANPPVCKILDYGKFLYRQNKIEQRQRMLTRKTEMKIIRLSVRIDAHDLDVKANKTIEFIKDRNSVKVSLMLKGREMALSALAMEKMNLFYDRVKEVAAQEAPPRRQGNTINMILIPQK